LANCIANTRRLGVDGTTLFGALSNLARSTGEAPAWHTTTDRGIVSTVSEGTAVSAPARARRRTRDRRFESFTFVILSAWLA